SPRGPGSVRQGRRAAVSEPAAALTVEQIQATFDASPFIGFLQLRAVSLDRDAGTLTVTMPMRPELERRAGTAQFHGGPLAAFIDIVGDFAVGMAAGGGGAPLHPRLRHLQPSAGPGVPVHP